MKHKFIEDMEKKYKTTPLINTGNSWRRIPHHMQNTFYPFELSK